MGIDKMIKLLKSCNKKRGKNLTLSVVIGFLLSCTISIGADFNELDTIFSNGNTISKETTDKTKRIDITYNRENKEIIINYNNVNEQQIILSLLDKKAYNFLLKGLENFVGVVNEDILTETQKILENQFDINEGAIFTDEIIEIEEKISGAVGQKINSEAIGINSGNIFVDASYSYAYGQVIDGIGINNGNIFAAAPYAYGQNIYDGLGINTGNIFADTLNRAYGQDISGIGINSGNIFVDASYSYAYGQNIFKGLGINSGNIFVDASRAYGQVIDGIGINNGNIFVDGSASTASGQQIFEGIGINNGVIISNKIGQSNENHYISTINNGIIIANTAYANIGTFYKNGVALKKENGKLILNNGDLNGEKYNSNINILGKNELTKENSDNPNERINKTFSEIIEELKNNSDPNKPKPEFAKNLFINNLGIDKQGAEDVNSADNQLIINKNLAEEFENTHITTAVGNNGSIKADGVIKIADGLESFSMDKSTIIGYFENNGTLVNMNGAKKIILDNSVISAFAGNSDTGFTGNAPTNVKAIEFASESNVTLNNSTVNGKMDFSAGGKNVLNLNAVYNGNDSNIYKDGTQYGTYASDIVFGDGNDEIHIKFGEIGQEKYSSDYDKTGLINLGNVNFGDGNDILSFGFDEMKKGNLILAGDIDFGTGEDKVALKSKLEMTEANNGETLSLLNSMFFDKVSSLETLQLADEGNIFYFEGTDKNRNPVTLDFTGTVSGGNGTDTFVLNSLNGIKIGDISADDNDILVLNFKIDTDLTAGEKLLENLKNNFSNLETLQLHTTEDGARNIIDVSELSNFKNILAGDTAATFKNVGLDEIEKIKGRKSEEDSIWIKSGITETLNKENFFGKLENIEELCFQGNDNTEIDLDKNLKEITFLNNSAGNSTSNITLKSSGEKTGTLTFYNMPDGTVNKNIYNITVDNDKNLFDYDIVNSFSELNIKLADKKSENGDIWKFENSTLQNYGDENQNGIINFDINKNNILLNGSNTENGKIVLNDSFIEMIDTKNNSIIFKNGTVLAEIADLKLDKGIDTELSINFSNNGIKFGEDITVKSYAFLTDGTAENNYTLKIKNWEDLLQENNLTDEKYQGLNWKYNTAVKNFNEDMGLTGALKYWTGTEIADKVVDYNGEIKDITVSGTDKNNLVSISGNANIEIDQNELASEFNTTSIAGKIIVNGTDSDGGTIDFTGTTVVNGGIDTTKSNTDITVNIGKNNADMGNGVTLGDIIFNEKQNNILNINNSSVINKIGKIENGNIVIENIETGDTGFSTILAGANAGQNNSVSVTNAVKDLEITTDYKGTLTLSDSTDSIILNSTIGELNTGAGDDIITIKSGESFVSSGTGKDIFNLEFSDDVKINLDGGANEDILNIGNFIAGKSADLDDIKVLSGKISDIETYNINKDITFANNLEISGAKNIKISEGKNLGLDIDYKITENGKVTGHALYNKGIEINNNDGKLVVGTANADEDCIISFGKDTASIITNPENVIVSNSVNHKVEYDKNNNDIAVKIKQDLELGKDDKIKYAHLNKIYQSIVSAKKTGLMAESSNTTDKSEAEAIKAQLEFYGKIYHSTPYAYSHEISEKSAELITDSLINNKTMPEFKKWIFGGSIAGQEADSDNNFYGANYYGVDNTKAEADIESSIYGAYAFGEYGITENQSVGFAAAGTKSDTDISGNSKIKGNSVFVSAYAKQDINNLRMIAGLGYQHGFYDSTRTVSNDYQSMSVDKKYEDDLFTIFAGARYSYSLGNNFFLEPNAKLNISHVMQNDINETDNNDLSIEVEEQDFTSVDTELGLDLVKKINLQKGILNLKVGASFIYSLEGHEEEYLTAKITGAVKDFEIISPESDKERVRFNIGAEYETETGMFYNLHGNYITSSNETDYCISFGAGYKF